MGCHNLNLGLKKLNLSNFSSMPVDVQDHIAKRLSELPQRPGVYIMKNSQGGIIYIGKAKVLKNRVRSYFDGSDHTGHRAATLMLPHIRDIEWIITESEREALILEANLIRKHTPKYNVCLKDDKHFPYIAVNMREQFPKLVVTRSVKNDGAMYFGPYMGTRVIRQLTELSARLFKIRECNLKFPCKPQRPCLNYHMGRCSAPCAGLIDPVEYKDNVRAATLLLAGKRDDLIAEYQREMEEASAKFDFETAAKKRDMIYALQTTGAKQKADSADPTLKLDVVAIKRNGSMATAVILQYRAGIFFGRRHFRLECNLHEDEAEILRQMLPSWYLEEETIPPEIAVNADIGEDATLLINETLSEVAGRKVSVYVPQRGEKVGYMKLAEANAEMLLVEMQAEARKYDEMDRSVFELQKVLGLKKTPFRIECVDISHLGGTNTVASLVSFKNGKPDKANYRRFIIKTVEGIDDFASMREVMSRRIRRLEEENKPLPDLWVCDGGKGQVDATLAILKELGHEDLPLIGLAKRLEEIVFPDDRPSIVLRRTNPALKLLQNARDEAHRFAITFQREKRINTLQIKWLDIPGVGEVTRNKILKKYRTRDAFLAAPIRDIQDLLGEKRGMELREKIVEYETREDRNTQILDDRGV